MLVKKAVLNTKIGSAFPNHIENDVISVLKCMIELKRICISPEPFVFSSAA
jgi:hypothetical protein